MANERELELWHKTLGFLEADVTGVTYNTWMEPLVFESIDYENNLIYFTTFIDQGKNVLEGRYREIVEKRIAENFGRTLELRIMLSEGENYIPKKRVESKKEEKSFQESNKDESSLNPKYTFDTFVVGDANSVANALSFAVAETPGTDYNPLFIYGGSGLGKTHLMHAIGHHIFASNKKCKILYVSSETFTNEFIDALKDKKMVEFRKKYRNVDILMIDDIQFIEHKEKVQEEFFHTFNHLHERHKQVVITSDKPPNEIRNIEERLKSRFNWGLSADVQAPDYELRMAILEKKAEQINVKVDKEVFDRIANKIQNNVRELEGALNRLIVFHMSQSKSEEEKHQIGIETARNILKDIFDSKNKDVTADLIKQVVCKHFQIKISEIESTSRSQNLVVPRQIAMYLCKELIGNLSFPKIADEFRKKDHSTVIHAYKKVDSEMKSDNNFKETVDNLINQINNY